MTLGTVTVPGTSSFVLNAAGGSTNTVPGRWGWMEGDTKVFRYAPGGGVSEGRMVENGNAHNHLSPRVL